VEKQLAFLLEIAKLKNVVRKSPLIDRSRKENSAKSTSSNHFNLTTRRVRRLQ